LPFKERSMMLPKRQLKAAGLQINSSTGTHPGVRCPRSERCRAKGLAVQLPSILQGESLTRLLQGAFVGFLATVVIGFNWGGWTLQSTATQMAERSASAALVTVLAPMCADKFRQASDAKLNMAELQKANSWMQDSYIQKGGWATFAGMSSPDNAVAQACAKLLTTLQ
jgi:hypothetical protein